MGKILNRALKCERRYNWLKAADLCQQALNAVVKTDFLKAGEIEERIGHCLSRAAFQAETHEEFKRRMKLSSEAYEEATRLFGRLKDSEKRVRVNCCRARAFYSKSWLVGDSSERKTLLNECWKLEKKALRVSKKASDFLSQGNLGNELLSCLYDRSLIELDGKRLAKIVDEAVSYGETAIEAFSKVRDERELARAYCMTSLHCYYGANITESENKRNVFTRKCLSYAKEGLKLSKKVGDDYLISLSNWAAARGALHFSGNMSSSLEHADKMLHHSVITHDNYVMGVAHYQLATITNWMMTLEEDPEKKREGYTQAIRYSENAVHYLRVIGSDYFIALAPLAKNYFFLAEIEIDREKKHVLLKETVEAGRKSLEHAERSGSPEAIGAIQHELSKALHSLSSIKVEVKEKKKLLEEASKHRQGYVNIVERMYPSNYWVRGVGQTYQALIGAELAKIELRKERKKRLLESAANNMDNCLKLVEKWATAYPHKRIFAVLGKYYDQFGSILNQLYCLTEDEAILKKAIKVYGRAVDEYNKAEQPSRSAEAYWNVAKLYDHLGENAKASENFESAAKEYRTYAEKAERLKDFYFDYASYMQAWSEIEKARYHHARQEYDQAKKHYEKAYSLHESSKSWKYLASNYLAWVKLEHGEDLSRGEKNKEAIQAFRKSAELFNEAQATIRNKLGRIENADERDLAARLVGASDARKDYCLGRVMVEEAKILNRLGDCVASAKKYELAAEVFQQIADAESGDSREELLVIVYLCQAWQRMMMAEAKASSTLFAEAAELFKAVQEHTIDKGTSMLALANSGFCKALEAGTEFEITRNMTKYSEAKRQLEAASSFYLKAGFKSASEFARATHRRFDAYVYLSKAETETDPEIKTRYFQVAQKLLQASVSSYIKANHPEKGEEVQRLLEGIEEEQRLVTSLTEVLHAPAVASTTSSFTTPTPTHEKAVGLDRFEHAAIEAALILSSTEVAAGEDFDLEMQIANVGKEAALLTKVEKIIPPSFELIAKPSYCHTEDTSLDMKGKKLDPLKTEEVKLTLRSFDKGTFAIKPRIVCLDETGSKMLCEPEHAAIKVSEVSLPNRVATGYKNLDCVLFGGIPINYAVILTSHSCDEEDLVIKRFLEAGAKEGQVVFYVTINASGVSTFAEEFGSSLYLFICNPQVDKMVKRLPNVFTLKGVENLTDISIALTSAFRKLDVSPNRPRRACIEIISDVLLQHHAVSTRRWLTGLIADLKSQGFTTLAVMNPQMHSSQEVQAILGLFEGQINIYEKETARGLERFLKVTKLYNQRYLESEIPLKKESI